MTLGNLAEVLSHHRHSGKRLVNMATLHDKSGQATRRIDTTDRVFVSPERIKEMYIISAVAAPVDMSG